MRHPRIRPCSPPRLPPPSVLGRIRHFRPRPAASFAGWVEGIDGDRLQLAAYEAGDPDVRLAISVGIDKARPTERAHMRPGTYVVLEVRRGRKDAPHRRFPLRLARTGRWTRQEIDDAKAEGRRLAGELRRLAGTDPVN